ncbi:ATP synthase F1 subunit epsilon [bacterium]|nr:MAG: ATP synthase F1 subunit epsilon [bacterium]
MSKLSLDVVTPIGVAFSDSVDSVSVEAIDGELGILPNHVPLFTAIKIGVLSYQKDGVTDYVAVMGGFVDVNNNKVSVLSPAAESASSIDAMRAKQDKEDAERLLMEKAGDDRFQRAEREAIKSSARLKAVDLLNKSGRGLKRH